MRKMSPHQPFTGVRIARYQRLENGFMISLSERDAPRTEHARIPIESHERPDISVEQVNQAAVSAGDGDLIVKVEVMPLAIHFQELVGRGIFLPQERPPQLFNGFVGYVFCCQPTGRDFKSLAHLEKFGEFRSGKGCDASAAVGMANHQLPSLKSTNCLTQWATSNA